MANRSITRHNFTDGKIELCFSRSIENWKMPALEKLPRLPQSVAINRESIFEFVSHRLVSQREPSRLLKTGGFPSSACTVCG